MSSRERVLAALVHREPDTVPVDFGSTVVSSLTRRAYDDLKCFLDLEPHEHPVINNRNMDSVCPEKIDKMYCIINKYFR